jgi:phenylacetate-CoA ligase
MNQNYLHKIEIASRDEINTLQVKRLKNVLYKVYNKIPFYKKKFDIHGVHPDDFKYLNDIEKFPFTTKEDLRNNYPFSLFAEPLSKIVRIHASSGTTGKATVVGYTKKDLECWSEVVARSIYAAGGRAGDMVHIVYGYGLFTGGLGAHYGAEHLGCTVIPISGGNSEKQIQLIEDFKPKIIMITPSYFLHLMEIMQTKNINTKNCSLEIGLFGAEVWSNEIRQTIESNFSMDAVDIYGLSEIIGPGVANECVEDKGFLYIWEDHFYPEIVNPDNGQVLKEGVKGELIFTSLTKEAMPLIRYRTRDLTALYPGKARSMRRMKKILGRCDDMLFIRGVNVFPSQIEEILLSFSEVAPIYQLVVDKKKSLPKLIVNFEIKYDDISLLQKTNLEKTIANKIKSLLGVSVTTKIINTGNIPRSQGKAQRVIMTY